MIRLCALLLAFGLFAAPAGAQIGLPVPTPEVGLPLPDVGQTVGQTLEDAPLRDLRRLRVRDLLRTHRRELEADPAGQPIVRSQLLGLGMSGAAIARAEAMGFSVVRRDALAEDTLIVLRAPRGMSTRRALSRLRDADAEGVYDFDHLHLESGVAGPLAAGQAGAARGPPRVGLVDSVSNAEGLEALRRFAGDRADPSGHGAIVASRLRAAAPGARIYAADIYGAAATGGSSSALARAMAWLSEENVPVINVSLVGPRNRIVEAIVARLVVRGHAIVAAVGNDGPAAAPLYPAAYADVIGVTAVDDRGRALLEAGRGAHVDFAAHGVVNARVRGTSYAAPIVAGLIAELMSAPSPEARAAALTTLRAAARDLGAAGRDDVYGYGLLNAP